MALFAELLEWLEDTCEIQRPVVSNNFAQTLTYAGLNTVDCNIRTLTGGEELTLDAIDTRATHRVVMGNTDVTEGDRLVIDGKTYNVRYVDRKKLDDIGGDFLQIDAEYIGVVQ